MDINDFKGKSWKQACDICRNNHMLIACSPDPVLREAAKLVKDHGAKAGASYIAAVLYAEYNDPLVVVSTGAHFYEQMICKHNVEFEVTQAVINLASGVAWGTPYNIIKQKIWPVQISEKTLTTNCGILNFLLHEGLKRMPTGSARESVVATEVYEFLKWVIKYRPPQKRKNLTGQIHYNEGVVLTASVPG